VVVLCFDSPLPLGKGSLHIAFEGTLNDQMKVNMLGVSKGVVTRLGVIGVCKGVELGRP
jgi:hypothetical protein